MGMVHTHSDGCVIGRRQTTARRKSCPPNLRKKFLFCLPNRCRLHIPDCLCIAEKAVLLTKKQPTVWQAGNHTIAKITILKVYLTAWFQITGRKMPGQDLIYGDGFAGPGRYTNHPQGPSAAALRAATTARLQYQVRLM